MASKVKGRATTTAPGAAAPARDTEHLVKRIKKELLWILISSAVAMGLGLVAGSLLKL
ncbi:hypothetical protein [Desulfovirgula thermocuniculi]|uniref:hypothetical protein n=1 Tax=Desulfovirgula thermocuniculi TaxID=348842 RepID=UPI00040CD8E5|nr:hypothetical protein [Desulfovirgula thermocuniculi]